jgi:hypothetical protein
LLLGHTVRVLEIGQGRKRKANACIILLARI